MMTLLLLALIVVVVAGLAVCAWILVELVRGVWALRGHQAKCDQDVANWTGEKGPR